jgi:prevent-host-death family protein
MTNVSIQELKQNLSAYLARAEAGESVVVTRHGRPAVRLVAAAATEVVVGPGFGKTKLRKVVPDQLGSEVLRVLAEDRNDRFDRPEGR